MSSAKVENRRETIFLPFSSSLLHFFKLNQKGVFLGELYPRKQIKWLYLESYKAWEKQRVEAGT
jgi:hypothetical protein